MVICVDSSKSGLFLRYLFMEFKDSDEATYALTAMQGFQIDSKHTFIINRFSDIERYANMDSTYVEPEPVDYKPRVRIWNDHFNLTEHTFFIGASSSVARRPSRT